MHNMIFDIIASHRQKSTQPYMERDKNAFNPRAVNTLKKLICKMQTRGRRGGRAAGGSVNRLVAFGVGGSVLPFYIGRQGDMPVTIQPVIVNNAVKRQIPKVPFPACDFSFGNFRALIIKKNIHAARLAPFSPLHKSLPC